MTPLVRLSSVLCVALIACSSGQTSAHDAGETSAHDAGCDASMCNAIVKEILAVLDGGNSTGACVKPTSDIAAKCAELDTCEAQCTP